MTLLVSRGFTLEEVKRMTLDAFFALVASCRRNDINRRVQGYVDMVAAIAGALSGKGEDYAKVLMKDADDG